MALKMCATAPSISRALLTNFGELTGYSETVKWSLTPIGLLLKSIV